MLELDKSGGDGSKVFTAQGGNGGISGGGAIGIGGGGSGPLVFKTFNPTTMTTSPVQKFVVQLYTVSGKGNGEGKITFACGQDAFVKLDEMRSLEMPLRFWIDGAESEKINCEVQSVASSAHGRVPRKVVFATPESEKVKVGELYTLLGMELQINVEMMPASGGVSVS